MVKNGRAIYSLTDIDAKTARRPVCVLCILDDVVNLDDDGSVQVFEQQIPREREEEQQ